MTDTTTAPTWRQSPTRVRVARVVMAILAVSALLAAVSSISDVTAADSSTRIVETWRMYGLATFGFLFAFLAWRPLAYRGLWELVIANKAALTITVIGYSAADSADAAGETIAVDGALTALLIACYVLVRGWRSGAPASTTP